MPSPPHFDPTHLSPGISAPALPAASLSPLPGIWAGKALSSFTHLANAELCWAGWPRHCPCSPGPGECRQRYLGLDSPRAASSSLVQPSPLTGRAHVFTLALLTGLQLPFGKGIKHSEMFRSFPLGPFPQKTCTLECAFNGSLYSISHHLRAWNSGPTPKWLCLVGRKMRDP